MAKIKVCLDAGHYGKYNRSPAVKSYYESDMNWKLHLLLKKQLEKYGIEVITTRSKQEKDLELTARGRASKGCDLFLSLHSNAAGNVVNESVDRPVVIVQLDGKGDALGRKLVDAIAATMATKQKGNVYTKKGNKGEYYGVLRGAAAVGTMGMLVEHSFHTNTRATNWLLQESNLQKLAEAEAKVIAAYFGIAEPVEESGVWYCVQVGAYRTKEAAEDTKAKLKASGFDGYITTKPRTEEPAPEQPAKKSVDEIAREVLAGKWGNGTARKQKLTEAGYDYEAVQKRVNELLKG